MKGDEYFKGCVPFVFPFVSPPLCFSKKSWRALNAPRLMRDVYDGKRFKDGIAVRTTIEPTRKAA
jgi:hypothetical protein